MGRLWDSFSSSIGLKCVLAGHQGAAGPEPYMLIPIHSVLATPVWMSALQDALRHCWMEQRGLGQRAASEIALRDLQSWQA